MAILIIAGITIAVADDGGGKKSPEMVGTSLRAFGGNLRSTKRIEKRGWSVKTLPLLSAEAEAIEAAVALGAQVVCSGTLLRSDSPSVTCEVEVGDSPYPSGLSSDGLGFFRVLNLSLREV